MHVQIWSIGKDTEAVFAEALRLYAKRLKHYTEFSLLVIPGIKHGATLPVQELKKQEARLVLDRLSPKDYLVVLDEQGKPFDTAGVSILLEQKMQSAAKSLIFLVGGAYGLDETVLKTAGLSLSLSRLTFPHQLARLILAEQLYRAFTILHHEKYHHQ